MNRKLKAGNAAWLLLLLLALFTGGCGDPGSDSTDGNPPPTYPNGSRFTDRGNGTIYDSVTRLLWLKNATCFSPINCTWNLAMDYSRNLASGQCGLSDGSRAGDWRLPTLAEYQSFIGTGLSWNTLIAASFLNLSYLGYSNWTASSANDANFAWAVIILNGNQYSQNMYNTSGNTWPVRSGQ